MLGFEAIDWEFWVSRGLRPWVQLWVGLGFTLLISYAYKIVARRILLIENLQKRPLLLTFLDSMRLPMQVLLWVFGFAISFEWFFEAFQKDNYLDWVMQFRKALFVLLMTWCVLRWKRCLIKHIEDQIAEGKQFHPHQRTLVDMGGKLVSIIIVAACIFMLLQNLFHYEISSLIALTSVGTLGLSLAAQDLFKNFFGGFMIYAVRPFEVGDWIRTTDAKIEGVVLRIGWYNTVIRSVDRSPLTVPNSIFTSACVENPGRMFHRRIKATVGVRYEDAPLVIPICLAITKFLSEHEAIDHTQVHTANMISYGDSSINIEILAFSHKTEYVDFIPAQANILLAINDIINSHGAQMPYPTRQILNAAD